MVFWHSLKCAIIREKNLFVLLPLLALQMNIPLGKLYMEGDSQNPLLCSFSVTRMKMILQKMRQSELDCISCCL